MFELSYLLYTLGLIAYLVWRFFIVWRCHQHEFGRRKFKNYYRIPAFSFGVLFWVLYAFLLIAYQTFEGLCRDTKSFEKVEQLANSIRTVCGIHFLFTFGSSIYVIVNFCIRAYKKCKNGSYESSDEVDDRVFMEELQLSRLEARQNL